MIVGFQTGLEINSTALPIVLINNLQLGGNGTNISLNGVLANIRNSTFQGSFAGILKTPEYY